MSLALGDRSEDDIDDDDSRDGGVAVLVIGQLRTNWCCVPCVQTRTRTPEPVPGLATSNHQPPGSCTDEVYVLSVRGLRLILGHIEGIY